MSTAPASHPEWLITMGDVHDLQLPKKLPPYSQQCHAIECNQLYINVLSITFVGYAQPYVSILISCMFGLGETENLLCRCLSLHKYHSSLIMDSIKICKIDKGQQFLYQYMHLDSLLQSNFAQNDWCLDLQTLSLQYAKHNYGI